MHKHKAQALHNHTVTISIGTRGVCYVPYALTVLKTNFYFQANETFEFPDLFGRYHDYREKVISGEDAKADET